MKKYLAEFIGTFSLVLFGCGAAVVAGKTIPITWLFIVAPILGAVISALIWRFIFEPKETV